MKIRDVQIKKNKQYEKLNQSYKGTNFEKCPFDYSWEYFSWDRDPMYKEAVKHLVKGNVLDNGGGFGYFRKFVPDHKYYNLDISPEMLKYDKGKNKILGSGENLPFDNKSFDNIVSIGVLRHVTDEKAYLDEAYRVLKPKGRFIITTPRDDWLKDLLKSWLFWSVLIWFSQWFRKHGTKRIASNLRKIIHKKDNKRIKSVSYPDRLYSEEWLKKNLEKRGFKIIYQTRFTKHLPGVVWQPFCEKFVNAKKYGQFSFFVCEK